MVEDISRKRKQSFLFLRTLPPGKVLVYEDSAMNEVHKAHLASELAAGRISVLENYHDIKAPTLNSGKLQPYVAMTIAQKFWEECLPDRSQKIDKISK